MVMCIIEFTFRSAVDVFGFEIISSVYTVPIVIDIAIFLRAMNKDKLPPPLTPQF
jgi:hypothetical protein